MNKDLMSKLNSMNSLIQSLNDKYLELSGLLTDLDKALANKVTLQVAYEDETGRHYSKIDTYDEDGIDELEKIYYRLERIVEGI